MATGTRMPKNLPRMNSRRPTGFDKQRQRRTALDLFGDRHAGRPQGHQNRQHHDQRQALVLDHLDVFAQRVVGDIGEEDQAEDADRQQDVEQRLRRGLLAGRPGDGGHFRRDPAHHGPQRHEAPPRPPPTPRPPAKGAPATSEPPQTEPSYMHSRRSSSARIIVRVNDESQTTGTARWRADPTPEPHQYNAPFPP